VTGGVGSNVPVILFPPPEAFMPSMASPFSREGAGAAWEGSCQYAVGMCMVVSVSSHLGAAVDGRVLANTVDLVAGGGVDDVVRLGSVARHDCGFGGLVGCRVVCSFVVRVCV